MTLSEKRHPDWKPYTDIKGWYLHDEVRESIEIILNKIRLLSNRDDKIGARILLSDGGGVNRFEVMRIIEEEMGEELTK